ncbi:MAG: hypothetical protein LKE30_00755 [Bacteroidales bacterium]|jgi:hypothetical protein|nr:hypothetical protein [Bacteroidales bacterium]
MGYANAFYNLYIFYTNGQGVEKNDELAKKYFEQYNNANHLNDLNYSNEATSSQPISEQETREDIHTIKSWVMFFGILTIIELIIGLIFVIKVLGALH